MIIFGAVILFVVLIILFISPLAKYIIEKNDVKWTGRQITMSRAYVNPFTGYVHFSNVKIFELNSDSVMLSVGGLSGSFGLWRLLRGYYEINDMVLDHPVGNIIQSKNEFNFMSFIKAMTPEHPDTTNAPTHFNIFKIKIVEGEFHYLQKEVPVVYFIKGTNIETDGQLFDADTVLFRFAFQSGPGSGSMEGSYLVNFKTLDYHYAVIVHYFDLTQAEQYLKAIANYGNFRASLDANLTAVGNFRDGTDVTARGQLAINDFHIGKNKTDDYLSFDKLQIAIVELSPKNKKYIFDSLSLTHPVVKYEQYEHLDNVQMMFGEKGANIWAAAQDPEQFNLVIEIARYVKILARNFFQSYYRINYLGIDKADLKYNDYSLSEKFSVAVNPLTVRADSIDKNNAHVPISFKTAIEPYGSAAVSLSINPKDSGDFDMSYHFEKIPVALFNPYLITYTSFPLDRGTIELKGNWTVRQSRITSMNHLIIVDPRVTKRVKNKNTKWVPLPLIMSFVREYGNVIDYEIPITGNLKNPKFHLHDVLMDVIGNIFIKPVTTPYRMEVKDLETEIEKSHTLKWQMRQTKLTNEQEDFTEKMAKFLKKNSDASIMVSPQQYAVKEKEYILFYEAKKKYFLAANHIKANSFSEDDSGKVNKMSVKDSLFIRYMDKRINDSMLFTIQDKCRSLVGVDIVNEHFKQLNAEREKTFLSYFKKEEVQERVKMNDADNVIPYNGFSFYKIEYKGEIPKALTKAYEKIQKMNDEAPRKKYER